MIPAWLLPSRAVRVTFGTPVDVSACWNKPITRKLLVQVTALLAQRLEDLKPSVQGQLALAEVSCPDLRLCQATFTLPGQ